MRWSLALYGLGLLVPFGTIATAPLLVAVPLIAFGGGVTMSLPYAVLIPMMPTGAHGAVTGLYSLSRGLGISLGPCWAASPSRPPARTIAGSGSCARRRSWSRLLVMRPLSDES
jgi:hypothetical protein